MKKIILDVDTGIDDALSIIYAAYSDNIRLEGVTTGFGNVKVEQATQNTLKVIEACHVDYTIPVAMGADKPLYKEMPTPPNHIHGSNGIGDYTALPEPRQSVLEESAADFIIRKATEQVNEITIVCVGRMTNLAIAIRKDPSIVGKVKEVVFMGGTLKKPGNVTPWAEANIYGDPDAAQEVFESGIHLTMAGLDITTQVGFTEENLTTLKQKMQNKNDDLLAFVEHIISFGIDSSDKMGEGRHRLLHDPMAIGVVKDPDFVRTEDYYVYVENEGKYTSGATISDFRTKPKETNVAVCLEVDKERFINDFIDTVSS